MMDGSTLAYVNRQATRRAAQAHKVPAIWQGNAANFRLPYVGDRTPRGWKRTDREPLFVDISGFGKEGEPALTREQFLAKLTAGYGYGLIEVGQFQGYVAEFIERSRR